MELRTTLRRLVVAGGFALLGLAGIAGVAAGTVPGDGPPSPLLKILPGVVTSNPDVTLDLLPPPTDGGTVRISNDGFSWVERPWTDEVAWSLIDPAAGGMDADGWKDVNVEYREAGESLFEQGNHVILDREVPIFDGLAVVIRAQRWNGWINHNVMLGGTAARVSLDGDHWTPWRDDFSIDLFSDPTAAGWIHGDHTLWVQLRDGAGSPSEPLPTPATILAMDREAPAGGSGPVSVGFELPQPAVTGELFTIRPVWPEGYVLPDDAWCEWVLHWGDDASIMSQPNATWGELYFNRPATTGICSEWTFTLPYREARQFHWTFQAWRMRDGSSPDDPYGAPIYGSSNTEDQIFRALLGSTDPHMTTSSVPIAYLLPDSTITRAGEPVTYRLLTTNGAGVPQNGDFWTYSTSCFHNPNWSQTGGNSYTYTPDCDGEWVTGWTGMMRGGYMRSQYDPLADGRAPKVTGPTVRPRSTSFGKAVPVTIAWSARDKGSGVARYQLQVSRNGRRWHDVDLSGRLTRSLTRSLSADGTYRFRVRARDGVGNWSAWTPGPTIRARLLQETSGAVHWSAGWARTISSSLSGGHGRATSTAGAKARLTSDMRGVSLVARRGPDCGVAEIWVDGTLRATVDLWSATTTGPQVVFTRSWGSTKGHTVVVRNLATDGRPTIELDAFLVLR